MSVKNGDRDVSRETQYRDLKTMPELRLDPLVQRWVVIAPERAKRPMELHPEGRLNEFGFELGIGTKLIF